MYKARYRARRFGYSSNDDALNHALIARPIFNEDYSRTGSRQPRLHAGFPQRSKTAPPDTPILPSGQQEAYKLRDFTEDAQPAIIPNPFMISSLTWKKTETNDPERAGDTAKRVLFCWYRRGGQFDNGLWSQVRSALLGSYMNILFALVPAGIVIYYKKTSAVSIFVVNFLAILPSAFLLGYATDQIGPRVGERLATVVVTTFSNAPQIISSVVLLRNGAVTVLRASLLGNMLSSLLLMTGIAFICGGLKFKGQHYNPRIAQVISMFLLLAALSLLIPTIARVLTLTDALGILEQSRGTSIIIIVSYGLWLMFAHVTNREFFENLEEPKKSALQWFIGRVRQGDAGKALAQIGGALAAVTGGRINQCPPYIQGEEEAEKESEVQKRQTTWSIIFAFVIAVICITLIGLNAEYATNSLNDILAQAHVSQTFIGIIVFPLLNFDPAVIKYALRDEMDLSLSLALEKCMQTALMIVPLIVVIAWGMGRDDMTLDFDAFSAASMFGSVVIVSFIVQSGVANWLIGALLIKIFIVIALAAYFVKDSPERS